MKLRKEKNNEKTKKIIDKIINSKDPLVFVKLALICGLTSSHSVYTWVYRESIPMEKIKLIEEFLNGSRAVVTTYGK